MSWIVLVLSGVLEAVWATALGRSEGFSRLWPTVTFGTALALSMAGLAFAMRDLPIGTAYAVWVGIGAVLTVGYAMATGQEPDLGPASGARRDDRRGRRGPQTDPLTRRRDSFVTSTS